MPVFPWIISAAETAASPQEKSKQGCVLIDRERSICRTHSGRAWTPLSAPSSSSACLLLECFLWLGSSQVSELKVQFQQALESLLSG